jgi:TetR/AcrR family transcriptional regulator of autoinduction and epiphytic fitness
MSTNNPPKRSYDSSRRKKQARQTRLQIIEAARRLFTERGYTGATIEAIALEAGVATETIYATFGSKREILSNLISVSLKGDDDPTPLLQRQGPMRTMKEKDQKKQIRLFAEDMTGIMQRVAPLFEVMRSAAKTEPDIAKMLQQMLGERVEGMKFFISALMTNGPLREGLNLEDAAETIWALTSGEIFTLLVADRGWPVEKYNQWLDSSLSILLLP